MPWSQFSMYSIQFLKIGHSLFWLSLSIAILEQKAGETMAQVSIKEREHMTTQQK